MLLMRVEEQELLNGVEIMTLDILTKRSLEFKKLKKNAIVL